MKDNWKVWDADSKYGHLFYNRAVGKLEEMESSKAAAKHVARLARANDLVLDVGCGCGHYLVSLDKVMKKPFRYHGIDPTANYIALARKAFGRRANGNALRTACRFDVGSVFDLDLPDNFSDLTMCNNVLLHLPSIEKPVKELWRVTKKYMLIRTLIGKNSFRIKQVNRPEKYSAEGEPLNFHFFNIYAREYIERLISRLTGVKEFRFIADNDFDPGKIGGTNYKNKKKPHDLTFIVNGMQVNNYIIQPWQFLIVEKR